MVMISANQIRAARGILNWPQKTLADKSGIGVATLRLIEKSDENITNTSANKLYQTLENAGLEFFENDGVGFRKDSIKTYRNMQAQDMLYDLFETAKASGQPVYIICKSWKALSDFLSLNDAFNLKRFERITRNIIVNCLLAEANHIHEQKIRFNFRALPGLFSAGACHCMIGNQYIIAEPESNGGYIYLSLKSIRQHEAFYNEFKSQWDKAIPLLTATDDKHSYMMANAI